MQVTTNSVTEAGDKTTPEPIKGLLYEVKWIDGTFDDSVDAVLSVVAHGVPKRALLTLTAANDDAVYQPRQQGVGPTGTVIAGVYDYPVVDGKLILEVTDGGSAKTGGMEVFILENS
jgi:hypothetical protein